MLTTIDQGRIGTPPTEARTRQRNTGGAIARPRLIDELMHFRSSPYRALSVWSSAGTGKSTLLQQWADHLEGLGDVVYFMGQGDPVPERLALDRSARPERQHWILLDDAHVPEAGVILRGLADVAPPFRLVLAGRHDPDHWSHLGRAGGERALHNVDLAFTPIETMAFAAEWNLRLGPDDAEVLTDRTGGWAVGLALAMPWLAAQRELHASVQQFGGDQHPVADYLTGKVLDSIDADDADLLMRAAVAPDVPLELAVAVTGRADVGLHLSRMSRMNLLVSESANAVSFTFHPVLLSYLQAEAHRRDNDRAVQDHQAAARWYAARGMLADALEQTLSTNCPDVIGPAVEQFGLALLLRGRISLVVRALRRLPADGHSLPIAVLRLAMDLPIFPDRLAAEEEAATIDHLLRGADETEAAPWRVFPLVFAVFLARDPDGVGQALASLEAEVALHPPTPIGTSLLVHLARARAAMVNRDDDGARTSLREVERAATRAGHDWLTAMACDLSAQLAARRGLWREVIAAEIREMNVPIDTAAPYNRASARSIIVRAARSYWRGERVALAPVRRVLAADPAGSELGQRFPCQVLVLAAAIDASPVPREPVAQLLALIRDDGAKNLRAVASTAVRAAYWARHLYGRRAGEEVYRVISAALGTACLESEVVRCITLSTFDYASEHVIVQALDAELPAWSGTTVVTAGILLAERADETGRRTEALERLRAALRSAEEHGFAREFLTRRAGGARLVVRYLGSFGALEPFAERVVQMARRDDPALLDAAPQPGLVLTPREIDLLQELPPHQTIATIAANRNVSVNTVKTHLRSIYGKLGVNGRAEAVAAARQRGLL